MNLLTTSFPRELHRLPAFASYMLRELRLAEYPTKQQLGILDWMENGPDRQITVGFRGVAKSTMAAIFALYRLRLDPESEKLLIPSNTMDKAVEVTTFMLRCLKDVDVLQCLEPKQGGRQSAKAFDVGPAVVDQSPSVRAVGILSPALTGKRATCVVPDDIETLNNSITPLKQERLAQAVTELEAILKPDEGQELKRQIMFLGTPHIETSLYLRLVRERNYSIRYWPARYPDPNDPEQIDCYDGHLDPLILEEVAADPSLVGEPTDPERFGHEELLKRETRMTRASVQLQFQLNCRLSTMERFPLRLGELVVMDLDGRALPSTLVWSSASEYRIPDLVCPGLGGDRWFHKPAMVGDWVPKEEAWRCVLAIDPAGRGHDELAWAVVAELNGNLFLLSCGGTRDGYTDPVLKHLAELAKRWSVNLVLHEPGMGDGMFGALLQPWLLRIHPVAMEETPRSNMQKERRIVDVLAPLVQQHRLVVSRELLRSSYEEAERDPDTGHLRSLPLQMSRLTEERGCLEWVDRVDALSMACAYFVDAAAQDQKLQASRREQELFDAELEALFSETNDQLETLLICGAARVRNRSAGGIRPRRL
jgi:hypothetical protein